MLYFVSIEGELDKIFKSKQSAIDYVNKVYQENLSREVDKKTLDIWRDELLTDSFSYAFSSCPDLFVSVPDEQIFE